MSKWIAGVVVLAGLLVIASTGMSQEEVNLCVNGDFEKEPGYVFPGKDKNIDRLVEQGWDLGEGMYLKVPDWTYSSGSAKVRIIEGEAGKEIHSGERCLMLKAENVHIYNTQKRQSDKEYTFSLYARGKGKLLVVIYEYTEYTKAGRVSLGSFPCLDKVPVSEEWTKYEGTIKKKNPKAKDFLLALVVWGEVYIDDVVLNY